MAVERLNDLIHKTLVMASKDMGGKATVIGQFAPTVSTVRAPSRKYAVMYSTCRQRRSGDGR